MNQNAKRDLFVLAYVQLFLLIFATELYALLIDEQTTRAVQKCIGEIRRELGISQEQLSAALETKQATYSKQERRTDMKLSTLRKAFEAMGCVLRIEVRLPDSQDVRELTFR